MAFSAFKAVSEPDAFASAIIVVPLFLAAAFGVSRFVGRRERAFDLASIILAGAAARVVGAVLRDTSAADASDYYDWGRTLSDSFRALRFDVATEGQWPGTGFVQYLSGLVQVITFNERFTTFLVFTALALAGGIFFYLAFARGLPDGNRQRYAALVFLWPSMAFWPSSIGKESWMIACIGLASYGASLVLTNRTLTGFGLVVGGIAGTSLVRPHVSVMVSAAIGIGVLIRRPQPVIKEIAGRKVVRRVGAGARVIAVALVLLGGGYLATQTQKVLKIEDQSSDSIGAGLTTTESQTTQGGSAFTPFTVRTPANYPPAFVTVLFRPFPTEARGGDALVSAAEGMVLLCLFALSLPRLVRMPSTMRREAYSAYALAMILLFVYAFSAVGNFGILARQRTQVLPFVFVLVCLPAVRSRRDKHARLGASPTTETTDAA